MEKKLKLNIKKFRFKSKFFFKMIVMHLKKKIVMHFKKKIIFRFKFKVSDSLSKINFFAKNKTIDLKKINN